MDELDDTRERMEKLLTRRFAGAVRRCLAATVAFTFGMGWASPPNLGFVRTVSAVFSCPVEIASVKVQFD